LVVVKNGKTYRRPSARAIKDATKNFYLISLISCRCEATLSRATLIKLASIFSPAGRPSITPPIATPWLSPKLVKVSLLPNVFKIYPIF